MPHLPKVLASQTNALFELLLKSNSDGSASLQTTSALQFFLMQRRLRMCVTTVSFRRGVSIADRAFDPERLETALASLPTTIIRGKGIVSIAGGGRPIGFPFGGRSVGSHTVSAWVRSHGTNGTRVDWCRTLTDNPFEHPVSECSELLSVILNRSPQ